MKCPSDAYRMATMNSEDSIIVTCQCGQKNRAPRTAEERKGKKYVCGRCRRDLAGVLALHLLSGGRFGSIEDIIRGFGG